MKIIETDNYDHDSSCHSERVIAFGIEEISLAKIMCEALNTRWLGDDRFYRVVNDDHNVTVEHKAEPTACSAYGCAPVPDE